MTAVAIPAAKDRMPPKLDDKSRTVRLNLVVPASWLDEVEEWRAQQRPVPNVSAAIRQLVELGLDSKAKR